jgi:hypothetical protein
MTAALTRELRALSRALLEIHSRILEIERRRDPEATAQEWLNRLAHEPAWAWLRSISTLIADIDHVLAGREAVTAPEAAAAAAEARGLLYAEGDPQDEAFLGRYRPLLQESVPLASAHGELKRLLEMFPRESTSEAERLHARHQWAMRCKQAEDA